MTIGNGLRYGSRYSMPRSPSPSPAGVRWPGTPIGTELSLGVGLLIGLIAVPLYLSRLLRA